MFEDQKLFFLFSQVENSSLSQTSKKKINESKIFKE